MLRYGSVCSGIEAASVAWEPLGMTAAWFAEVDPFCNTVLAHRYPNIPNLGDITREDFVERAREHGDIDILVGGTPCQSFSTAGLRGGLADFRGNLALRFLQIARTLRPAWVVWENVPGVLSSSGGRDFGTFLGALVECGYGWAYRVLDAQHFGVPQRRRRVFVVGHLGDQSLPVQVLFDQEGEGRDSTKGGTQGAAVARPVATGPGVVIPCTLRSDNGGLTSGVPFIVNAAESCVRERHARESEVARCLDSTGSFATNQGGTLVVTFQERGRDGGRNLEWQEDLSYCLTAPNGGSRWQEKNVAIAFQEGRDAGRQVQTSEEVAYTVRPPTGGGKGDLNTIVAFQAPASGVIHGCVDTRWGLAPHGRVGLDPLASEILASDHKEMKAVLLEGSRAYGISSDAIAYRLIVRRLTPRECERLQGFPDDWTLVPRYARGGGMKKAVLEEVRRYLEHSWGRPVTAEEVRALARDSQRYKAIGNSMCVNVMRWIGRRLLAAV